MHHDADGSGPSRIAVRVASPRKGKAITVVFAGELQGVFTHHAAGRTVLCGPPGACPAPVHRLPQIWKGYAAGWLYAASNERWEPCVIEVTELLEEQLRGQFQLGQVWTITRDGRKKTSGPLAGELLGVTKNRDLLRAFDIRPTLCRFFHVNEIEFGAINPVPARTYLSAVAQPRKPRETAAEIRHANLTLQEVGAAFRAARDALNQEQCAPITNGKASH